MAAVTQLSELLAQMAPELSDEEYVFASFPGARYADLPSLAPIASVQEAEGLSLLVERSVAETARLSTDDLFRRITLNVHSSLKAVGLTAAVSKALAEQDIPANMIAGTIHDHIFVPADRGEEAMQVLKQLS